MSLNPIFKELKYFLYEFIFFIIKFLLKSLSKICEVKITFELGNIMVDGFTTIFILSLFIFILPLKSSLIALSKFIFPKLFVSIIKHLNTYGKIFFLLNFI